MKKIGLIGAGLLSLLAHGGKWLQGTPVAAGYRAPFYRNGSTDRTAAARHWHNPADPVQAARIEAAAAKRERKAEKCASLTGHAWSRNYTHHKAFYALENGHIAPLNLNPFYIAK